MKLKKDKTLVEWLQTKAKNRKSQFPGDGKIDYFRRFKNIEEYLNNEVHKHVNSAALLTDGGYLTDHGPDHVSKVIRRASELVSSETCNLTAYEVYLLLAAIHFHDVGNIFGRDEHVVKAADVMREMDKLAGTDAPEKRWIREIAEAHGGADIRGDKDKIGKLPPLDPVLSKPIRIQLLAAILRFADELSDDAERAARFLLVLGKIPKESEIHHKYAECLHSVIIDNKGKEVSLHFGVEMADVMRTFGKGVKKGQTVKVYLVDEILERTMKTHFERLYCSRFMRRDIFLDVLRVKIEIFTNRHFEEKIDTIGYELKERGYPQYSKDSIYMLCPELKSKIANKPLSGENLAIHIQKEAARAADGS